MKINFDFNLRGLEPNNNNDSEKKAESKKESEKDDTSIFADDKSKKEPEVLEINFGILNGRPIVDYDADDEDKVEIEPNVDKANIVTNEENQHDEEKYINDMNDSHTFADVYSMIHDTYGHKFSEKEYAQILHQVVTNPANKEIFKDVLNKQDFENAYKAGNLDYMVAYINGITDNLSGVTLPKVEIKQMENDSVPAMNSTGEPLDINFGILNGKAIVDYAPDGSENLEVEPNVDKANIVINEENQHDEEKYINDMNDSHTFADVYSMIHDTYGHKFSEKEYIQILHQVVTDPANKEIFKDVLNKKDFENAYKAGNLDYMVGYINGITDDLSGITLPKVEIQTEE